MSALFRRGSGRQRPAGPAEQDEGLTDGMPADDTIDGTLGDDVDAVEDADVEPGGGGLSPRPDGPWDVTERSDAEGLIDLGALRLRGHDGMELRLEVEESSGMITAATVQLGGSAVQLQAFAAPRSEGIWDEIRSEISAGITRQGGTVDDVPGVFGRELIAKIPVRTPDGRTGHQPARFVGIDGPRWFLRAVFHGQAVHEPAAAGVMEAVVRDIVVVRGPDAMAPRDLLPLRLPDAAVPEPEAAEPADRPPLEPFRRGPEITEIR